MPVALISTSTSPSLGPSRSTVSIESGFPASHATAARTCITSLQAYKLSWPAGERATQLVQHSTRRTKRVVRTTPMFRRFKLGSPLLRAMTTVAVTSNIQCRVQRVVLDEFAPRLDEFAHQLGEEIVGLVGVLDFYQQKRAPIFVERRLPQLIGVHLAETLIALQRQSFPGPLKDRLEQLARRAHLARLVPAPERSGFQIRGLQAGRELVELARIRARDDRPVDRYGFAHAADIAPELHPAVRRGFAVPAALGFVGELVESSRDIKRRLGGTLRIGKNFGIEGAGNCRLLDEKARILPRESLDGSDGGACL